MDGFEINKILGAILFALLVVFGTRTVTDIIFAVHAPEKPGYEVAVTEEGAHEKKEEAKPETPLAQLLANADAAKGERLIKPCQACHTFDQGGANKIGPNLHGVVGRDIASVEGFSYSPALKEKQGKWSYEDLNAYLQNPKGWAPGTKMAYAGVKNDAQRADLILYLRSLGGNPPPLPQPQAAVQPEAPAQPGEQQQPGKQEQPAQPEAPAQPPPAGPHGPQQQ